MEDEIGVKVVGLSQHIANNEEEALNMLFEVTFLVLFLERIFIDLPEFPNNCLFVDSMFKQPTMMVIVFFTGGGNFFSSNFVILANPEISSSD